MTNSVNYVITKLGIDQNGQTTHTRFLIKKERMISISYESFENLDEKKKQKIINAGFSVFAKYGYAKASVDEIVKLAGISKGSLFYYFQNKQNFFNYLYDYSMNIMHNAINSPDLNGKPSYLKYTDFFERLNAIQLMKMKANLAHPQMGAFIKKMIFDSSSVAQDAMKNMITKYQDSSIKEFLTGLDLSKFKNGIDPLMVIQLIIWCSEGCVNQVQTQHQASMDLDQAEADFEQVVRLYYRYVELFRKNFYKDEYV